MASPKVAAVGLSEEMRGALEGVKRRHQSGQQLVKRVNIVLLASEGHNHQQIADALGIGVEMARRWRRRWESYGQIPLDELSIEERLSDEPRPGRPMSLSSQSVTHLYVLAAQSPAESGRAIAQWDGPTLADELIQRGHVASISARHVRRLLKKGRSSRTAGATG